MSQSAFSEVKVEVPSCNAMEGKDEKEQLGPEAQQDISVQPESEDKKVSNIGPTMTKNQLKKLKKKEHWQKVKAEKRKAEKERYKARKRECRERGEELGPSRKQLKHNKMSKSGCKVKVAIDCDFDDYMMEKDIKMLVKQIQFSYSANRRAENPLQFYCCGLSGKTSERLESLGDYKGWDINFHSEGYMEKFDKESVVYLSSESPNVLQTLTEDKVYIIGGLVDHNHHKGLCHRLAEEKGITHAQLPISEYIDMKTRKVLTINHVFEILLHYTETKDWQKAFYTVLPPRKGAVPKLTDSDKTDNMTKDEKYDNVNNGDKSDEQASGISQEKNSHSCDEIILSKGDNSKCELTAAVDSDNNVCDTEVGQSGDTKLDKTDVVASSDNHCKGDAGMRDVELLGLNEKCYAENS